MFHHAIGRLSERLQLVLGGASCSGPSSKAGFFEKEVDTNRNTLSKTERTDQTQWLQVIPLVNMNSMMEHLLAPW